MCRRIVGECFNCCWRVSERTEKAAGVEAGHN